MQRYKKVNNVKYDKLVFTIPDALSFVWQIKEIFVDEIYNFESKVENPVIYDCGANIGTSCLYFKKKYPNAIIKAFEADLEIVTYLKKNLLNNNLNKELIY